MSDPIVLTLLFVGAYLLGSIPFGLLVARAKGIDLTKVGSGNVGATNVNRALGKEWGIATFIMDMVKGFLPTLVARMLIKDPVGGFDPQALWLLVGMTAVFGHAKSIFWGFKGGKGISTSMGVCLAATPLVAIACFSLFVVVLALTRYMSIASMVAVPASVPFTWLFPNHSPQLLPLYGVLSVAVVVLHRKNIDRLREGTEPKFRFESKKSRLDQPAEPPPTGGA